MRSPIAPAGLLGPIFGADFARLVAGLAVEANLERRASIQQADHPCLTLTVVAAGAAQAGRTLADGGQQIVTLYFPGDLIDPAGLIAGRTEVAVESLTPVRLIRIDRFRLMPLLAKHPDAERCLVRRMAAENAQLRERVVSLGRRSALTRMAHLLCEFVVRVPAESGARFPLTQIELADVLGLSPVHINRVLHQMRDDGLVSFKGRDVVVLDQDRLSDLAGFDAAYLNRWSLAPAPAL
ncbi:MAG TPA: Crp/Fnr family transcriptional regulator [Caulobacteraceae bacterium]|jgi:CRP-like cAMP-binding protein|nr:Crp/Fnr family transcriptional regulator [Caulobacteraceae bacterium]